MGGGPDPMPGDTDVISAVIDLKLSYVEYNEVGGRLRAASLVLHGRLLGAFSLKPES